MKALHTGLLVGLGGAAVLGLLAAASSTPSNTNSNSPEETHMSTAALKGTRPLDRVPGVHEKPGVAYTLPMFGFLAALRASTSASTPIVVTSGKRTAERQAKALLKKLQLKDDLTKIYKRGRGPEIVAAIMAAPRTVAAITAVLLSFMAQGVYMSRHMRGDALDLRSRGLSAAQVAEIKAAAEALGARVLVESTPAHIHIERISA